MYKNYCENLRHRKYHLISMPQNLPVQELTQKFKNQDNVVSALGVSIIIGSLWFKPLDDSKRNNRI